MTRRNRLGSHVLSWRLRHRIEWTLTPVLLPRPVSSAAFLFSPFNQRTRGSWQAA